ncbi:MAG: hypothetical protein PHS41_04210 [Victivallaceae bacterium]|nr:hypothetical protein [Victivallaceae bacterium]
MKRWLICVFFSAVAAVSGAPLPAWLEVRPDGTFMLDGHPAALVHNMPKWGVISQQNTKTVAGELRREKDTVELKGQYTVPSGRFNLTQTFRREEDGGVTCDYVLTSEQAVPTGAMYLSIPLPVAWAAGRTFRADGKLIPVPVEADVKAKRLHLCTTSKQEQRFSVPLENGELTIEGNFQVVLQDNRLFHKNWVDLQLWPKLVRETPFREWRLRLKFFFRPNPGTALDLRGAANMGFADETAEDGRGGWTDQGPANDLRSLTVRKVVNFPVEFAIVDPARNHGKSCLVLGGGGRPAFPRRVVIPCAGKTAGALYLLHALAWAPPDGTPVGTITARYDDGTTSVINVHVGSDVGDWWKNQQLQNGLIAWRGQCDESAVCLYLSEFRLAEKPLRSLEFASTGKAVWMVVAGTTHEQPVVLRRDRAFSFRRGPQWRPFDTGREIEPGSALDFSAGLDAPAGKYGFLKVDGSVFCFEKKSAPVRFYGTNVAYSANFLTHDEADRLADRLARIGYNAVRLHHFDRDLVRPGKGNTVEFDAAQLDKLDYLVAAFKKRGLYLTFDLFTDRRIPAGEFSSCPQAMMLREYKLAAMLVDEVKENFKTFSRKLLEHKNPYTNLRWADDPVFIGMSVLNENTILHNIDRVAPWLQHLYRKKFEEDAAARKIQPNDRNRAELFRAFLLRVYDRYWSDVTQLFRETGVKIPLSDQNFVSAPAYAQWRVRYDYVDNHTYWSHPMRVGKNFPPFLIANASVLSRQLTVPKDIAPSRIFGKPFTVTEFDFCYPDSFRAEGAPVFGAFAARQDWNAIYRFGYSHNRFSCFRSPRIEIFDCVNDPVRLLSERLGIAFFLRGDVAPANRSFPVAVSDRPDLDFQTRYPNAVQNLMFFGKVGSLLSDGKKLLPAIPADAVALFSCDARLQSASLPLPLLTGEQDGDTLQALKKHNLQGKNNYDALGVSIQDGDTEITANFRNWSFRAITPKSECLTLKDNAEGHGRFLTVKNRNAFGTFGAIALDGRPLGESGRILLLHLTDVKAEGMQFGSERMDEIQQYSKTDQRLARHGVADLSVAVPDAAWKLYALDFNGCRVAEVPFSRQPGKLNFRADTFLGEGVVFAYELVR